MKSSRSTIRGADQILVMENGEIVERGTHEALLAASGRYKHLYDKQYKFERDLCLNTGEEIKTELPKVEIERKAPTSQSMSMNLTGI